MSLASKLSAGLLAAACVCSLAAAEVLSIHEPADFKAPNRVAKSDDGVTMKGSTFVLFSAKTAALDPAKQYTISGEFRLKEGEETGLVYLGLAPLDAEGKLITPASVNVTKGSDTVVAKAAAEGDTVIFVKDASKWDAKTPHGYIAFNTKEDYSDLPNRDYLATAKGGIEQEGDLWKITLKAPLKKAVAEGTAVRQQKAGATYIYLATSKKVNNQDWVTLTGKISGAISESGLYGKKLWHGTASVRILVMMLNGKKGNVIEMKNIALDEAE